MTWAYSPAYGSSVVLGPTQAAVYRFVMGATEHGRRPTFTLSRIAEATGKPVSSVHDALGRLRALGLIGCATRMGRTGGHRLWRVVSAASDRALDVARHRRAVARVLRRWVLSAPAEGRGGEVVPSIPLWPDPGGDGGAVRALAPSPSGPSRGAGKDSDGGRETDVTVTAPRGPSFRELIGLHHRLPWEPEDLSHGRPSFTDTDADPVRPGGA